MAKNLEDELADRYGRGGCRCAFLCMSGIIFWIITLSIASYYTWKGFMV